jgi:glycerophosphoryl diester phosphodiesterase
MGARQSQSRFVIMDWPEAERSALNEAWIRRVQAAGAGVISWPVTGGEEAARLSRMGVDGLLTKHPAGA